MKAWSSPPLIKTAVSVIFVRIRQAHPSTVTGAERPRREGPHGLSAALSPRVTPSTEFIPFSFWYDAPLTSQYSDRRHDPWQVYGSPTSSPALRDRVPNPYGRMADGWETADRAPVYRLHKLPPPNTRRPAFVHLGLPQNLCPSGGARALIRHGPGPSESVVHVLFPALLAARRALGDAPARSLSALAQRLGVSEAAG